MGERVQGPQWMPDTEDSTESVCSMFSKMHICLGYFTLGTVREHPNGQYHYTWALWLSLDKIRITWTQHCNTITVDLTAKRATT